MLQPAPSSRAQAAVHSCNLRSVCPSALARLVELDGAAGVRRREDRAVTDRVDHQSICAPEGGGAVSPVADAVTTDRPEPL